MDDPWWTSSPIDWTRPEPIKVYGILKSAYPAAEAILELAGKAGLPQRETNAAKSDEDAWRWTIDTAASGGRLFVLYDAIVSDPDKQPFHDVLYKWLHPKGDAELQTINVPALGLIDAKTDEEVSLNARRRTAMIEIGGLPAGTGFLVGPDLLLTAAHVVDAMKFPPATGADVIAIFDFLPQIARSRAETGIRIRVTDTGLAGSLPTQSEIDSKASDFTAPDGFLDFLLMRLERDMSSDATNGPPRGFYELHKDEYAFGQAQLLRIAQHPLGQTLHVSHALGPFTVNMQKTRVRYRTNTLGGSSGSAVFDTNGRLVALHHFAGSGFNQGVLISKIAGLIEAKPLALPRLPVAPLTILPPPVPVPVPVAIGPDPFETLGFGDEPFAGRVDLRNTIKQMLNENDRRILVIEGGEDAGKTFSHRFLTHLMSRKDDPDLRKRVKYSLKIANIDLDEFVAVPRKELQERIVQRICTALGLVLEKTEAQPARRTADLVQLLAPLRIENGVVSWIFFDSLNRHNLDYGQVRELIVSLLQLVRGNEASPLRLVISSRPPIPLAQDLIQWAKRDKPEGLSREDVQKWFTKSAEKKGHPLDDAKLTAKLNELFPAGIYPSARNLAPALPTTLDELLMDPA